MIQDKIRELVQYGLLTGLVSAEDEIYTTNRLLELFQIEDYPYGFGEKIEQTEEEAVKRLPDLLTEMMDYAVENGILQEDGIVYRDLFDTKIMSCLVGRPSEIIRRFHEEYEKSPEAATDFFYKFSQDTDYIRRYRVCRDEKWVTPTKYGDLDITINLSKPEKRPQSDCGGKAGKAGRLSEMSALCGKRGLCRSYQSSGTSESPDHSVDDQRQQMGISVFSLCVL